ncbi:hypothetical protein [Leifsonia sp. Root227]|uniref:hypothetical protein n=1 Tax=Leifsonia sp. Root227 TaxID=1736496 RepID=UPI0012F768CA|nr:hypothetical protein [Leifsonia sp. Root227]
MLTGAIVLMSAVVLALSFVFRATADAGVVSSVSALVTEACAVGFFVWAYLYLAPVAFDPPTNFARTAMETARLIPTKSDGWQIGIGYSLANLSGKTARALMTVVTGRRTNVAGRPDVTRHAAEVAEGIMLVVPVEGPAFWRNHTNAANDYAKLLHDINGLVGIGRTELIPEAIRRSREDVAMEMFVSAGSAEVRRYLHPMAETTAVEATVRYLVPLVTMTVAIATLFATLGKQ